VCVHRHEPRPPPQRALLRRRARPGPARNSRRATDSRPRRSNASLPRWQPARPPRSPSTPAPQPPRSWTETSRLRSTRSKRRVWQSVRRGSDFARSAPHDQQIADRQIRSRSLRRAARWRRRGRAEPSAVSSTTRIEGWSFEHRRVRAVSTVRAHARRPDDRDAGRRAARRPGLDSARVRPRRHLPRVKLGRHVRFVRAAVEAAILAAQSTVREC
jgi:hypothetical protein